MGILSDYVDWARILFAIWRDRSFEQVAKPVELVDLARLARINTSKSSLFQLHWWIFGTILPKHHVSMGDNLGSLKFSELTPGLQQYCGGDAGHVSASATILSSIILFQTFPDLTLLKEVSGLSSVRLLLWFQDHILRAHLNDRATITLGEHGRWVGFKGKPAWTIQTTLEAMLNELRGCSPCGNQLTGHQLLAAAQSCSIRPVTNAFNASPPFTAWIHPNSLSLTS